MRWEQQGGLSSHWTIAFLNQSFLLLLLCGALLQGILASFLPPLQNELYYWAWAQKLQPGYLEAPPMVAYWIRASTSLFGNSLFGLRFFAVLSSFVILFTLSRLCEKKNLLLFLLFSPLFLLCGTIISPQTPLLFFWTLYVFWLTSINKIFSDWSDDPIARVYRSAPIPYFRWSIGGCLLGLGFLSHLSMLFAIPCTFLVLLSRYRVNSWIKGFIYHLALATVIAIPYLLFNQRYEFEPLRYQWAQVWGPVAWGHFWGFVASQILLLGALPFFMTPWVLVQVQELKSHFRMHVCFIFFFVPFFFMCLLALRSQLEFHAGLVAYLSFWPIAQKLLDQTSFRLQARGLVVFSFLPPFLVSGLLFVHAFTPLRAIPVEQDWMTQSKMRHHLSQQVIQDLRDNGKNQTLFSSHPQWVSLFRFQGLSSEQLPMTREKSSFTLEHTESTKICQNDSLLDFSEVQETSPVLECFQQKTVLKEYSLVIRGKTVKQFQLVEYRKNS